MARISPRIRQHGRQEARFTFDLRRHTVGAMGHLTVRSGSVHIRGIRFELDSAGAEIDMSAVSRLGGSVVFEDCEFVQIHSGERSPICAVRAAGAPPSTDARALVFTRCYFEPGQQGIVLTSPLAVRFSDCAFAPLAGSIVDVGGRSAGEFDVSMMHCSALAASDAIFRCRDGVNGTFSVENSLFGQADSKGAANRPTALIAQVGPVSERLRYRGSGNVYYGIKPFFERTDDGKAVETVAGLESFHKRPGVEDDESQEVSRGPGRNEPLKALEKSPGPRSNQYRTKGIAAAARRHGHRRETCSWGKVYSRPPPPRTVRIADPPGAATRKSSILRWSARKKERIGRCGKLSRMRKPMTSFSSNTMAPCQSIQSGSNGLAWTSPYGLQGFKPVLKLGNTTDSEAALSDSMQKSLRLEDLEIHLAPSAGRSGPDGCRHDGDGHCR